MVVIYLPESFDLVLALSVWSNLFWEFLFCVYELHGRNYIFQQAECKL